MQYKITESIKKLFTSTEKLFSLQDYQSETFVLANEFRDIQENLRINKAFHQVIKDALGLVFQKNCFYN